jgi:hypothetical protein
VIFEPQDLLAKLAALVPAPRVRLVRFHGLLGPAAAWRPLIIPTAHTNSAAAQGSPIGSPESVAAATAECAEQKSGVLRHNYSSAQLMKLVFAIDVLQCDRCGGVMRIIAPIHPPDTTRKILDCLGLPSRAPPLAPAVRARPAKKRWNRGLRGGAECRQRVSMKAIRLSSARIRPAASSGVSVVVSRRI